MGCGGIIRDGHGKLILSFAGPSSGNPRLAILNSILYGLNSYLSLGITNITIEAKCFMNIHCLLNSVDVPCDPEVFYIARAIKQLMVSIHIDYSHVLKDGNASARWLALFGAHIYGSNDFVKPNYPMPLSGLIRLDKISLPYVKN
ncbi:uncharacterized protein LOC114581221 [Dendrobium catenatum]|uniref:uncharacterized protein LOC114581221 n=1 Tax=Dendrobium catenatum TaxID=906689 RepID=UPI00109F6ABA|nr:uncharacterized protein LOC114581221 [Dendrobium catenatum]